MTGHLPTLYFSSALFSAARHWIKKSARGKPVPLNPSPPVGIMSEYNPCLDCGACCAYFRVSFFWGECQSSGGVVPDDLVVQINPTRVAMIGTDAKPSRCISLNGEIGKQVGCSIYANRSSPCREFDASWVNGVHNPSCDDARAAYGLPPLMPPGVNEPHWPNDDDDDDGAKVA